MLHSSFIISSYEKVRMCVITVKLPGWPEQDYISIVERLSSLKESKPREGQLYPLCQESLPILYSSTSWFGLPTFKGQQYHPLKFVFALQMHVQKNLWKCNYRQTECVCKPYYRHAPIYTGCTYVSKNKNFVVIFQFIRKIY